MSTRIVAKTLGKEEEFYSTQDFSWLITVLQNPDTELIQAQNHNNRVVLLSKHAIILVSEDE